MTLLDILAKLAGNTGSLVDLLKKIGQTSPDLKPIADQWLAALNQAASADNLVKLAAALPAEIANIFQGKLSPADHPSDAI